MSHQFLSQYGVGIAAGTTQVRTGTAVFSSSNTISFGMQASASSMIVTASAAGLLGNAIQSISAGTTQITSGEAVFSDSNGLAFGVDGQTLTAAFVNTSYWNNMPSPGLGGRLFAGSSTTQNLSLQRVYVPRPLTATRADMIAHLSVGGSTAGSFTISLGFYTISGSTASLASSTSVAVTFNSGTNQTAASIYGAQSGTRWRSLPLASWAITPGEYMLGCIMSIGGVAGTTGTMSIWGRPGVMCPTGTTQTTLDFLANGYYTAGTSAFPSSIVPANITFAVNTNTLGPFSDGVLPYFQFAGTF